MFPRDPLPDRIGPYKILRRLASRRGADLYLGHHDGPMGFKRQCVLKLVPSPSASGDPATAEELAHEAKICSRLNHPAIVRMFDFFEHGDHLVLVLEHFAGVSLARLLSHFRRRRQRVPDAAVWYLAHRLFSALAHAHALVDEKGRPTPVIHRDIQPAHIVMSQDANVRLAGFGIAKIAGSAGTTAVGFVKGTPAYMAPEQAAGEKVTERVDVYAAGLVVWEMLSARSVRPPGDVGQGADLLRLIAGRRFEPISSLRRDVPREVAAAIDACLVQSASKRTIRCREVERWLEKVVDVEAGKKELRERLVQLRNANVRTAPAPRTSVSPRASQPPPPRALPSRFPGLATRVTGRVSEREEGDSPRSSHRVPALRAPSSYPAAPLCAEHEPMAEAGPGRPRPVKKTLLGMAPPSPASQIEKRTPGPDVPSHDAMPPPPLTAELSRFVSGLKRPPGVQSVRPNASEAGEVPAPPASLAQPERVEIAGDTDDNATSASKPLLEPPVMAVAGRDMVERGDTTIISRRRFERARKSRLLWLAGGAAGVAVAALSVGGWLLVQVFSQPGPGSSASATPAEVSAAVPAEVPAVSTSAPVAAARPAASAAPAAGAEAGTRDAGVKAEAGTAEDASVLPPLPKDIPPYAGAVMVTGPPYGTVYVSGVPLGETGEWIQIACNRHHFVRVGTKPGPRGLAGTSWLVPGQSVMIRCEIGITVPAMPRYPARQTPSRRRGAGEKFEPESPF